MNRPKIVQAQCPSCHWQSEQKPCLKNRMRGHRTVAGAWFRNLDCNQWAPFSAPEEVPDLCPTCGRPIPKEKIDGAIIP